MNMHQQERDWTSPMRASPATAFITVAGTLDRHQGFHQGWMTLRITFACPAPVKVR